MPIDLNSYRHLSRKAAAVLAKFGSARVRFIGERGQFSTRNMPDGWSLSPNPSTGGLLYVVERHFYREVEKVYPIERLADLKAVLAQQYAGEHCAHLISEATDHQRLVVTFVYQKSLQAQLPRICLLLPESLVIAAAYAAKHNKAVINSEEGTWFLYVRGSKFSSQTASPLCPDLDRFAMIHGVPDSIPQELVSQTGKIPLLIKGLTKIPAETYLNFLTVQARSTVPLPWKLIGSVIFSLLLVYFSTVTLYLQFVQKNAEQRLENVSKETTLLLKTQREQEQLVTKLNAVQSELRQQKMSTRAWSIVFYLIENEVKISSLLWAEGQLTVQGATPDAINLLQKIAEQPYVGQARFSESTRRERGLDNFSMAIVFADEAKNAE